MVESLLKEYHNVLVLRVRMPIVADLTYPRNFITKIIKYEKARRRAAPGERCHVAHAAPAGLGVAHAERAGARADRQHPQLDDGAAGAAAAVAGDGAPPRRPALVLPRPSARGARRRAARAQARRGLTGIMNYTNPGAISHNEILELYKQYVDPEITWANFSLAEQAKVIVAPRSNNLLDTGRVRARARPAPPRALAC
jgi:hypothetical protein